MPRKAVVDKTYLMSELLIHLRRQGLSSAASLCEKFKISQATFSRLIAAIKDQLVIIGKARDIRYAVTRKIPGVSNPIPIYEINGDGICHLAGNLYPINPQGFYFEAKKINYKSAVFPDLPYFLNDLRPNGFLGRLIPIQNSDFNFPADIRLWTAEQCLYYLTNLSWNNIGNLILGENAFQLYLKKIFLNAGIKISNKKEQYALYAKDVLSLGDAGSSAGGEQPKFTTTLLPSYEHVIVKFSPPTNTEIGKRIADILISENITQKVLKSNAIAATESEIIIHDNRVFLEVKRFDRENKIGRCGLISLGSLDAEFTAASGSWSNAANELIKKNILPVHVGEKIRWIELFGRLIANNDMHFYNLSFLTDGEKVTDLAPVYDMSPMFFAPRNNQVFEVTFSPPLPSGDDGKIWESARNAAEIFWEEVSKDNRISHVFREVALNCKKDIISLKQISKLLPKS